MRWRSIVFIIGVLFFMLSGPAVSSDWVDIKSPKELRALYSNKTFRSTFMGVPVIEHYRADGKGISISAELRSPLTWEVKGNDQVCVSGGSRGKDCCRFQRHKKNRDEYVKRCADAYMVTFKVEDGVPEF